MRKQTKVAIKFKCCEEDQSRPVWTPGSKLKYVTCKQNSWYIVSYYHATIIMHG